MTDLEAPDGPEHVHDLLENSGLEENSLLLVPNSLTGSTVAVFRQKQSFFSFFLKEMGF
jgi:hypothetical protein